MDYVIGYGSRRRFLTPDELKEELEKKHSEFLEAVAGFNPEQVVLVLRGGLFSDFNIASPESRALLKTMVGWWKERGYGKFVVDCVSLTDENGAYFFNEPYHQKKIKDGFNDLALGDEARLHILKFDLNKLLDGLWEIREEYDLKDQLRIYIPPITIPDKSDPRFYDEDHSFLNGLVDILIYGRREDLLPLFEQEINKYRPKEGEGRLSDYEKTL